MDIKEIAAKASWKKVEKRPTWGTVTSRELATILGVSLQSINNWLVRDQLPEPEPRKEGYGNKNRYRISKIRSWLENKPEDEIHWEWVGQHMDMGTPYSSLQQAQYVAWITWDLCGIEKVTPSK